MKPNDTLLNMLGANGRAYDDAGRPPVYLCQAFTTASRAFQAIDKSSQGIVVPLREKGKAIIAELCSSRDLDTRFSLLRRAQAFISLFPHGLQGLQRMGAIREVQLGSGILYLDEKFYSNKFGISVEGTEQMEDLIA
jgi:CRISPR-associated endonuclease/helicase Cas3